MISFDKNQLFIVTGASSGLGEATAIMLNSFGATVIAIARNANRLQIMKKKCRYPDNMHLEIKDLADDINDLPAYIKKLKEKYGKFSGLAYCAGITDVTPLKGLQLETIQKVLNIDYLAPIFLTKGVCDKRNNIGNKTSIVVVSSLSGIIPSKGMLSYCGAKAAIINSMKVIAKEYSALGIRINTVSPSDIATPMTQTGDVKSFVESRIMNYPFGIGEPNDVANMITFLLSDKAKFISGQNYVIDSGGVL